MSENNNFDDEIIDVSSDPVPSTSMSINEESLYYPVNEKIKTGFGRMIRPSLPNIGNHLKRLMRFKSQREVNSTADNERSEVVEVMEVEDQDEDEDEHLNVGVGTEPETAIYNQTVATDLNDSFQSSNLASGFTIDHHPSLSIFLDNNQVSSSSSAQMEISIRPSNLFQYYSNSLPLASSSFFTNDLPAESDLTISTLYYPNEVNPLMISQSLNTSSHVVYDMTLANIINEEGAIVARNPLEFAATLDIFAGDESSHRIAHEPRRVPLIVSNNNNHVSSLNVGNSLSSGSESSSESVIISEFGETNSLMRRRRHEVRQLYDVAMRRNQCGSSTGDLVVSRDQSGMDCMPLRPEHFDYLLSEQAKSRLALRELQHEVGALLEFRDLVIETFPDLRHKMAASATASVISSPNSGNSGSTARRTAEWEPGKVRRRIAAAPRESETPTSLPRSRSNSHSGGSKNSATVQDSGFSTETSSKDSASTAIPLIRPASPSTNTTSVTNTSKPVLDEAEDELWNLLDVIHRKGIRLREEVESLQVPAKRLDEVQKSTETLSERLDKAREENDDLRFQLDRQNIELEGTRALVRVLEKQHQQLQPVDGDPESEVETREPCCLEAGSSTESARDHHQPATVSLSQAGTTLHEAVKPSPRRRPPSRIPLPDSSTKSAILSTLSSSAPSRASYSALTNGKSESRESLKTSLKSLTAKPPRDSSRDSFTSGQNPSASKSLSAKTRDSSRESLNKSLPKNPRESNSRESLSRSSLPRSNNSATARDSLSRSSLSRARDSLESAHTNLMNSAAANNNNNNNVNSNHIINGSHQQSSTSTSSTSSSLRRPLAPARRSHSLARVSIDTDTTGKALTDPPSSWCSSSSGFRLSDSSLCPDSLNPDDNDYSNTATSITGSTKIEFIIGSPTRRFKSTVPWQSNQQHQHINHQQYFDSINSSTGTGGMAPESLMTDEFPPRSGEALAECDSLDDNPISSED